MKMQSWFSLPLVALLVGCSQPPGRSQPASSPKTADSPSCPSPSGLPQRPFALPDPATDPDWTPVRPDLPPGTGYVGPVESADAPPHLRVSFGDAAWFNQVVLPLYDAPGGEPVAWLACGWLMQAEEQSAVAPALFYPGYIGFGFIVKATQGDWLELRYANDATAWVAQAHLAGANLAYISWGDRYRAMDAERPPGLPSSDWGYLSFISPQPQPLYAAPDSDRPVATLDPDHALLPLEIRDDWMQVRVFQPGNFCVDDWQGETQTGWIRWHDSQQGGNQLREPYKGC